MQIEIKEVSSEENIHFRSSSKWNTDKIKEFATDLNTEHAGKIVRIPLEQFYKEMYSNPDNEIKHLSYYCKKRLQNAFKELEMNVRVTTTKKWNGCIVVQL